MNKKEVGIYLENAKQIKCLAQGIIYSVSRKPIVKPPSSNNLYIGFPLDFNKSDWALIYCENTNTLAEIIK